MGNVRRLKIGILTSSRADYGIYLPLLQRLQTDPNFHLGILAFGTHLSEKFGYTVKQIENDGFTVDYNLETLSNSDSPKDISLSMARTIEKFSEIWPENQFDLVFALGDRYEMFAAVISAIPFNIKVAHIHGGETTLGAIDNSFRHSITAMSNYHFTAAEPYKQRVIQILGHNNNVFNVGALSIDNIKQLNLLSIEEFKSTFNINLAIPTILSTFHPETISFEKNRGYVAELISTLSELSHYQIVITMPNTDTMGQYIRGELEQFINENTNVIGVENFGTLGYLSCMKHCKMLIGNTSSGFIEASGLEKPVVNIGDRQKGRIITPNIFNTPIVKCEILKAVIKAEQYIPKESDLIYGKGDAASKIVEILKILVN
jgi:GDP/UDP-N,N'-diacetylbacillosamine 2-epimerase (hydrolysing)